MFYSFFVCLIHFLYVINHVFIPYILGLMFLSHSISNTAVVIKTVGAAWKMLLIIVLTCLLSGIIIWAAVRMLFSDI